MQSTMKLELNYHDQSDKMWAITKKKKDNDVMDKKGVICVEYDIELSRPIRKCAVYDKTR